MANVKISELPELTEKPASDDRIVLLDNSTTAVKTVASSYYLDASPFTKVSANVVDSPYTVPSWESVVEIHNDTGDVTIVLPTITADDVGKEIKFWIEHNPANHKVEIHAPDTSVEINNITSEGAEVAKASFTESHSTYTRVTAQAMATDEVYISDATSVYNALRYSINLTSTSDFSPFSHLTLSAVPTDFLTSNADWWFAVKMEHHNDVGSDGGALFMSNSFGTGYRGNGTYLMTSGTSSYLQTISPTTLVEDGQWIIYQYDSSTAYYTAWINGVKVLNATSAGVTPPSLAPTEIIFGSEAPNDSRWSAPSGYLYPLQQAGISVIAIGTGNLADSDAALFTNGTFDPSSLSLSSGALTNQWSGGVSGITTDVGAINITSEGANVTHTQL